MSEIKIKSGYHEIKQYEPLVKMPETKKKSDGDEYITCWKCEKNMMVWHACYNKKLEPVRHILEEKDVCHWCWDNVLKEAVEQAESCFL
jgi:hypothetical protein